LRYTARGWRRGRPRAASGPEPSSKKSLRPFVAPTAVSHTRTRDFDIYYGCSRYEDVTSNHALGPLEMQVLGLFEKGAACSVSDIQERLRALGEDPAYTTVMTVLSRLHEKGVLARKRDGKRFLYSLSTQAQARTSSMVERVHRTLFKTVRARPIAALIEESELTRDELKALRALVDEKLKERKR
jgi:BlaI family transcriptional regulator, penicillinase repressor